MDETTDVSVTKLLILYAQYFCHGDVLTSFIRIVQWYGTIADTICKLCSELGLDMLHHLCGLGSDGASVMLGSRGRVSKLLRDKIPFIVSNHCIAHRLVLACGQAAKKTPYIKQFKAVLDQLYRFYKFCPVHTAGLKDIQDVLNDTQLHLTQAKDVRWLSHEKAVSNLHR